MSQISRGIFAAIAVSLTLGAVPLALGRDLTASVPNANPQGTPSTTVNRAAKVDRVAGVARADMPTRTISLQLSGLSETSVLVRIPVAQADRARNPAPALIKSGDRKAAVACEPVVSVLTEVAKLLGPGRCVT